MTQNRNFKALEQMDESLRSLQDEIERFKGGERFWRSTERSRDFVAAIRRVQSQLEAAQNTLREPANLNRTDGRYSGWLSRKAKGLFQYLGTGGGGEFDESREEVRTTPNEVQGGSRDESVIEGHGAMMEVSDLIAQVQGQGMTGVLTLNMPDEVANLHFEGGQLVHAYSENAPKELRLGEVLVRQGITSPEYMESLLSLHWNSPLMLGETLLDGKIISIDQLRCALNYQIQCLFDRIAEYRKQTSFCFVPGLPKTNIPCAQVDVIEFLLDSGMHVNGDYKGAGPLAG